ncbi:hypothetical protein E2562_011730 [Oryza meyeriana var. granulata]|uniref:Protein FAR1-RELATED SEQUENCE n=1 Tax=Oryza meyeriana var. granulata TaxID=110450 RepID=A0A6G1DHP7_9ORYZ|nr:hypothetical protein E2562_011730 [Oryza meyeriana var. granulata]
MDSPGSFYFDGSVTGARPPGSSANTCWNDLVRHWEERESSGSGVDLQCKSTPPRFVEAVSKDDFTRPLALHEEEMSTPWHSMVYTHWRTNRNGTMKGMVFSNYEDQDATMAAAIPRVFPNIIHRLCRWHILHKHADALNILYMHDKDL